MNIAQESIQGLDCLTVKSRDADTAVVFLHGYGANMQDLFPLWELWHQEKFDWYFPNGCLPLPMGYYEGRAWYSIDMAKLQEEIQLGRKREVAKSVPAELDQTLKQLEVLFLDLNKKYKKLIIGGFSQGAMLSSHLAMMKSLKVDGLVLLSGNLLAEEKLPKAARAVPFYQSHGSQDPILSLEGAKELEQKLHSLNFPGKLHVFPGGHEIPMGVIHEVRSFLQRIAAAAQL